VDVGLALPHYDHSVPGERPLRWETVLRWAVAAEAAGLGSVWISDHLFLSLERWGVSDADAGGEVEGFEALSTLAALARATTRVRLGTLVLCPHLRPPGALAKALATIDVVSDGRLTVGLGAGWFEPEYVAADLPFPPDGARVARMAETLDVLRLAFTGEPFDYAGEHVRLEGMVCRPRPVQRPGPPLWVGGRGDRLLGIAARGADGWNAGGWVGTVDGYRERAAVLDAACEAAGREPSSVTRSINRLCLVGEDEADLRRRWEALGEISPPGALRMMSLDDYRQGRLVGTVDQVAEQLAAWEAAGVATVVVSLGALPFTVTGADDLALLASASGPR
jgi:probable F420-dependent oxidoreductase